MTVEERRREIFESFYLGKYYEGSEQCGRDWLTREPCGNYRYDLPARHWETFNAALDAVVIDLDMRENRSWGHGLYKAAVDDFRAAIEAAGLGLKVLP